ncbi:MAG: T9SS C-terminal target domain-containing protein [Chitinophagia bacterium]|nr:T9SS C-terminal target domain-containing protein [Chitinophagia bacterium]
MYNLRFLIFASFLLSSFSVLGQINTEKQLLRQSAIGFKLLHDENYSRAVTKAKEKGWPLTIKSKDGRLASLVGVDRFGIPQYVGTYNNTIAAATTRANQLWPGGRSGLNLSGSSASLKDKIGIWDGGRILNTHLEINGRITQKDNPSSFDDHGTHVAGTMIASGVNPLAKGMAFGLQGMIAYDFNNDNQEMFSEGSGLLISNHSYGYLAGWQYNGSQSRWEFWGRPGENEDYRFGYYDDDTKAWDSLSYLAPNYLIVKSAGNNRNENGPAVGQPYFRYNASGSMASAGNRPSGISSNDSYDILSTTSTAKNILTVGAVNGIPSGYSRPEDVVMSAFSSWGPTDDGRIKPDIVADGVGVTSSIATGNSSYSTLSGTSMSSPNASGSLILLQEHYNKLKSGSFMRSATLKGIAIHTADEAGFYPGPDYQFGWGLLNVEKGASLISEAISKNNGTNSNHLLYENNLADGANFETNVIASGKGQLSATICWTDPAGKVEKVDVLNNRTKKLVNDLDIRITKNNGFGTYLPWTLNVDFPGSAAIPGDNITDNVERINIDSTVPGQSYKIRVTHKGKLVNNAQAYSLIVSGVGGTAFCTSSSGGGGARIDSVNFSNLQIANPTGSKTYTDYTRYIANIEPLKTIPISIKVSTADATTNSRIIKVFIDFNNNGTFEAGELMATSGTLSSSAQTFTANISIPGSVEVGNISLMRIVVQETTNAADVQPCGTYAKGETQDYRVLIVSPSNDVSVNEITSPSGGDCESTQNYLTIKIKNNGSLNQSNIPITAVATAGGSVIASFSTIYTGIVSPGSLATITFQNPFPTAAATTYTISASINLLVDQNPANNQMASTFITGAKSTNPVGIGSICSGSALLKVTAPIFGTNYFWYNSANATIPFASGFNATTASIPADKTFYLGKEIKTSIGPANKMIYTNGGYNTFTSNFVRFNNAVPIVIESSRLYVGNPGKIRIILADLASEDLNTGSYSYYIRYSTTLDAPATNPNPKPGAVIGNPIDDPGAVFYLNIPVNTIGDHILILQCLSGDGRVDSASVFRNNQITTTNTYPISIPGVMSINGNSATTGGSQQFQFYYYFYDMRIRTSSCPSSRVAVVANTPTNPVITQQADSLVSSYSTGNQWYLNDSLLIGVNNQSFKPSKSGIYKVIIYDAFGCQLTSNTINYSVTALAEQMAEEIKLRVSPNPNKGKFNLSFSVTNQSDLWIDILDASGKKVFSANQSDFIGNYAKEINLEQVSSSLYIVRIQHNKKIYLKKIIIQR